MLEVQWLLRRGILQGWRRQAEVVSLGSIQPLAVDSPDSSRQQPAAICVRYESVLPWCSQGQEMESVCPASRDNRVRP